MRYLFFVLAIFTLNSSLQAQEDNGANTLGSFRIDILTPGIGGELQLRPTQTLEGSLNLGFGFGYSNAEFDGAGSNNYFLLAPNMHLQYRYYFNRAKRLEKGKSIYNNSGLFFGVHTQYSGPEIFTTNDRYSANNGFQIGPIFGAQKTFQNNLQLGFSMGYGYNSAYSTSLPASFLGSLNFSYVIFPKKT